MPLLPRLVHKTEDPAPRHDDYPTTPRGRGLHDPSDWADFVLKSRCRRKTRTAAATSSVGASPQLRWHRLDATRESRQLTATSPLFQ